MTSDKIIAALRLPTAVNDTWYADLMFLGKEIPVRGGYIGFLSVLDSPLALCVDGARARDKTAATIAGGVESIILAVGAPRLLVMDNAQEQRGPDDGRAARALQL